MDDGSRSLRTNDLRLVSFSGSSRRSILINMQKWKAAVSCSSKTDQPSWVREHEERRTLTCICTCLYKGFPFPFFPFSCHCGIITASLTPSLIKWRGQQLKASALVITQARSLLRLAERRPKGEKSDKASRSDSWSAVRSASCNGCGTGCGDYHWSGW